MYLYQTKQLELSSEIVAVKDVDTKTRTVSGYFASFRDKKNPDSDGDIIIKGAFLKTIREQGPKSSKPRIAHLKQHSPWDIMARIDELVEDSHGLKFHSYFPTTTLGEDSLKLYEAEIYREHSIGYRIIKAEQDHQANVQELKELKLWEGSAVTWGSDEFTYVDGVKSMDKKQSFDLLDRLIKALRDGSFTDETFYNLEIGLEQVKSHIDSLVNPKPAAVTLEDIKPGDGDLISHFKNSLKI